MKYIGTHFHVSETEITATGRTEVYIQPTRDQAIAAALYTHQLHDGAATASINGVITCPTCGHIAITQEKEVPK